MAKAENGSVSRHRATVVRVTSDTPRTTLAGDASDVSVTRQKRTRPTRLQQASCATRWTGPLRNGKITISQFKLVCFCFWTCSQCTRLARTNLNQSCALRTCRLRPKCGTCLRGTCRDQAEPCAQARKRGRKAEKEPVP